MNKLHYDWDSFFRDSKKLAELVKEKEFESLLIITRGGMFLGGMLSEYLGIKIVETISISQYEGQKAKQLMLIKSAQVIQKPLIIDDIADKGMTLAYVKDMFNAPSATLFYKPTSIIKPDYYIHETEAWVVFPWEVELDEPPIS